MPPFVYFLIRAVAIWCHVLSKTSLYSVCIVKFTQHSTAQHITGRTDHVRLHFALWQVALWIVADALKCDKVKPFVCILCIHTYWLWRLSKVDTFISKFKIEPNFSNSANATDTMNTCMQNYLKFPALNAWVDLLDSMQNIHCYHLYCYHFIV